MPVVPDMQTPNSARLGPRCAAFEGYNIHANVSFDASDRGGLERLCRYVLRPPLALGRLERRPSGRVLLALSFGIG